MSHEIERLPLARNASGRALVLTTLALLALGVVMVHSAVASVTMEGNYLSRVDVKHSIFAVLAAGLVILGWRMPYRWFLARRRVLLSASAILLAISLLLAVAVLFWGHAVGGKRRWLRIYLGFYTLSIQPSELVKLWLTVFLVAWLGSGTTDRRSFTRTFLPAAALLGGSCLLVAMQDFGTAAIIAMVAGVTMLLAGIPWYYMITLLAPAAGGFYALVVCDESRWGRILAVTDPWTSTSPSAYQPRQSLVAILTGGWFGKGIGNGVQKLGYLPEDSTDFIFSVFCEEWGFAGAVLLMGLVMLWIYLARKAAVRAPNRAGALLAGALGFMIALQAVLHIAVDIVAMPPTGMSLPFISAGGTALMTYAFAAALIVSVSSYRRPETVEATPRPDEPAPQTEEPPCVLIN